MCVPLTGLDCVPLIATRLTGLYRAEFCNPKALGCKLACAVDERMTAYQTAVIVYLRDALQACIQLADLDLQSRLNQCIVNSNKVFLLTMIYGCNSKNETN